MKLGLVGYGKMGRMVEQEALAAGHEISFIAEGPSSTWSKADVVVEFTKPDMMVSNLQKALKAGIPMVTGTTGWNSQIDQVRQLVEENNGSFFHASNFSIGVNIFFEMNRRLAGLMSRFGEYTVAMEEIHHTEKKDSPSGTAITAAQDILQKHGAYADWVLNEGQPIPTGQLSIKASREPNVPGTHIVRYESSIDEITLRHDAKNRKGFAQGAIMAAEWINGKRGIYTMNDILSLS